MIDFSGYTKANIEADMLNQVDPNVDTREGSMVQTAVAPGAWWLEGLYLLLQQIQSSAYAETAVGDDLDKVVKSRNIEREAAVPADRQGTFLDSNGNPVMIPLYARFKTINGEDSVVFYSMGEISSGVYYLRCETPGIIGNSYTGAILPITPINNLATATIGTIITAGTDTETDAALRTRYFESFEDVPFGGNIASYRRAILAMNGVGAVQVIPNWYNMQGYVKINILDDNLKPVSADIVQAVQTAVCPPYDAPASSGIGIAPIGAKALVYTVGEQSVDIACSITWETGRGGASDIQAVENAISAYIASTKETWGTMATNDPVTYVVSIYLSRITVAILSVDGVTNVTNVTIDGSAADLVISNGDIPKLGTVTIT